MPTLYDVLQTDLHATDAEIERAYKARLDTLRRGDEDGSPEEVMVQLKAAKEAYQILSSPSRRRTYDDQTARTRIFDDDELEYVGFWPRVGACVIDTLILIVISWPLLIALYGWSYFDYSGLVAGSGDFFVSWVFPAVAVIVFWIVKQATPGKMAISARILDAETGAEPSAGQLIGRYFGYYLSGIPFGLGFFWVAFDSRKQGWHDKLAGTVVVRPKNRGPQPVKFDRM